VLDVPGLVLSGVGTFALSLIVACLLLRMRCRGIGPAFGPRARYSASFIVVSTAVAATAVGLLIVAATRGPAFVGVVVAGGLWFTKLPPQRDRDMLPRTWSAALTLPFSRLYDRMGEDMQDWCDTRIRAAAPKPQWITDAAQYYWNQMGRVTDQRARANMERWRDSIAHKISVVRLIDLGPDPGRLPISVQLHPSMRPARTFDDDYARLARRLETEALNELHLFLAYAYRLGYHKMLIYPFRPEAHRPETQPPPQTKPAEPITPER
jgi:hypothetical protein